MKRLHLIVSGRVQGVCFRLETQRKATQLGLMGWVRNLPDGSVELVAEGPEHPLTELSSWCAHGPPQARVTGVKSNWEPPSGEFSEFSISF